MRPAPCNRQLRHHLPHPRLQHRLAGSAPITGIVSSASRPLGTAATRAQARSLAVAERHGQRIAGGVTAPLLPAAVPVGSGLSSEGPSELFWGAGRLNCRMGVQLGFIGVQLGGKVIWAGSRGLRLQCGNLPGSSGRLSPCLPDDGAPRCGCRRPVLACSSIPADRGHRFRRSHDWTGRAGRCCRLFSPAKCGPGRPLPF
jgi:hypothetical protein